MRVRNYDKNYIRDALALLKRSNRYLGQVAEDLGIPESTLRYWRDNPEEAMGKKKQGKPAKKANAGPAGSPETAEEELARLRRENAALRGENDELRMDREILKKAAAFFAKESE